MIFKKWTLLTLHVIGLGGCAEHRRERRLRKGGGRTGAGGDQRGQWAGGSRERGKRKSTPPLTHSPGSHSSTCSPSEACVATRVTPCPGQALCPGTVQVPMVPGRDSAAPALAGARAGLTSLSFRARLSSRSTPACQQETRLLELRGETRGPQTIDVWSQVHRMQQTFPLWSELAWALTSHHAPRQPPLSIPESIETQSLPRLPASTHQRPSHRRRLEVQVEAPVQRVSEAVLRAPGVWAQSPRRGAERGAAAFISMLTWPCVDDVPPTGHLTLPSDVPRSRPMGTPCLWQN